MANKRTGGVLLPAAKQVGGCRTGNNDFEQKERQFILVNGKAHTKRKALSTFAMT